VRGGELTTPYRYFDGGDKLARRAVGEIALYGRSIAFVADAQIGHPPSGSDLAELTWKVAATAADGSDFVPNAAPGETMVIRQSDGRAVKLGRG
jgi:hypothetical protein